MFKIIFVSVLYPLIVLYSLAADGMSGVEEDPKAVVLEHKSIRISAQFEDEAIKTELGPDRRIVLALNGQRIGHIDYDNLTPSARINVNDSVLVGLEQDFLGFSWYLERQEGKIYVPASMVKIIGSVALRILSEDSPTKILEAVRFCLLMKEGNIVVDKGFSRYTTEGSMTRPYEAYVKSEVSE